MKKLTQMTYRAQMRIFHYMKNPQAFQKNKKHSNGMIQQPLKQIFLLSLFEPINKKKYRTQMEIKTYI